MKNILLTSILTIVLMQFISSYVAPPEIPKRPTIDELKSSLSNNLQSEEKNTIKNNKLKINQIKKPIKSSGKE